MMENWKSIGYASRDPFFVLDEFVNRLFAETFVSWTEWTYRVPRFSLGDATSSPYRLAIISRFAALSTNVQNAFLCRVVVTQLTITIH